MRSWQTIRVTVGIVAAAAWVTSGPAQEPDMAADVEVLQSVGLLPHEKESVDVPPDERNPFEVIIVQTVEKSEMADASLQEQKIRQVFSGLAVSGVTETDKGGKKILIGGMILEEGMPVPHVISNQTERLEVVKITEEEIEIGWIEDDEASVRYRDENQRRKLFIPLDTKPKVVSHLPLALEGREK